MDRLNDLIKTEFPQAGDLVYLNHAAVAPWPARTAAAVKRFADENALTGAMHYPSWLEKEKKLRRQLQILLNAPSPDDIALLKNTSEALSVVASGITWRQGDNVVSTDQEFPSNRIVWQTQARHGVELHEIDIMNTPEPEQALIAACNHKTRVLAVSSVQYGTGFRLDLETLGHYCHENGVLLCVDAIQSIGAHALDVQAIHADFVMADAHKWMLGPEGIAVFYCHPRRRDELQLHQYGWHMVEDCGNYDTKEWQVANSARRFECGSSNMLGIHALSASLSLFEEVGIQTVADRIEQNVSCLMDVLGEDSRFEILTPASPARRAGIVTFRMAGVDMADLHQRLLERKIVCAHRLGGIRFSPHFYISLEKIDKVLEVIDISI